MGDLDLLKRYFPQLSEEQIKLFAFLPELYKEWNEKINVVSRKDIDQIFLHHILHSLSIAKLVSFKPGTTIVDAGTGGGFPGIPLAIFFPETEFILVDSIGKKITVVQEISTSLNLQNVTALKSRAEDLDADCDFVVSRAVAPISDLYRWTRHLIKPKGNNALRNGWIFLKGGDLTEEINASNQDVKIIDINNFFKEDFFLGKKLVYMSV